MAEFSIKITGLDAVRKRFKAVNDFFNSRAPMQNIVDEIKEGILDKTEKGHDYMGRNFKPYSKAYAKRKGQTRVDLRATGEMMDTIDAEVTDSRHGRVFINSARKLIAWLHNQGGRRLPQRQFMKISKSALQKLAKKHVNDPLMRILGRR